MTKIIPNKKVLFIATCALFLCVFAGWTVYALFAHKLIEAIYNSENAALVSKLMAGRSVTPLEMYYYTADTMLLIGTVRIVSGYLLVLLLLAVIKQPVGMAVSAITFLICSFALFSIGEFFPFMIKVLRLDAIPYFARIETYVDDDTLAYRERPFHKFKRENYQGSPYSRLYGVHVPPRTIEWITDEHGFRNSQSRRLSDIVVLGDSFVEYADNEADTFGKRLERRLSSLTVTNMGKAGYNPFQYLEVFKRYALPKNPTYALFCFYEGNDIPEMKKYSQWKNGIGTYYGASQTFFHRYRLTLVQTVGLIRDNTWMTLRLVSKNILDQQYYPELVVLRLGENKEYKTLFIDLFPNESTDEMLESEEWITLRNILREFKRISIENKIVPIIIYIPMTVHIYADYTNAKSGVDWLNIRDEQLGLKANVENAMMTISRELEIDVINLVPFYEAAAKKARMVYDLLDSHWSSDGREIAARAVAEFLKSRYHDFSK